MMPDEGSIRFIGYGAMLTEGVVAIMALVAAATLVPNDYYLINGVPKAVAALGIQAAASMFRAAPGADPSRGGRDAAGANRRGGVACGGDGEHPPADSRGISWRTGTTSRSCSRRLFILTTIDAGTRVGPIPPAGLLGNLWRPLGDELVAGEFVCAVSCWSRPGAGFSTRA